MSILITGATSPTGDSFLKNLSINRSPLNKSKIKVIVRRSSNHKNLDKLKLPIQKIFGDLEDETFLERVFENTRIVFHIAGIRHSVKVISAAIKNNVKWVILIHTTAIYSKNNSSAYHFKQIENKINELIRNKNIQVTFIRPTMIYGHLDDQNMSTFISMIDKLRFFPLIGKGSALIQPVHIQDIGSAFTSILNNENITKGKSYILSGKSPISIYEALKIIQQFLSKKNIYFPIPLKLAYYISSLISFMTLNKVDFRERILRLGEDRSFRHTQAHKDFGFCPREFREGILEEVLNYKKTKFK